MQHNEEFRNIFPEMYQELEKLLINLDHFVDKADNNSLNVVTQQVEKFVSSPDKLNITP